MKIAFFGTSDRSTPILEALKKTSELELCITKKDSLIGRNQEVKEAGVKKWCKENNIKFIEISSLKDNDLNLVLDSLKNFKINFGIICDFSFIIPRPIIDYFEKNLINIHFSLLPKYRGASPVQFSILKGDFSTGVTFQTLDYEMDKGDILDQYEYSIDPNINSGELYQQLFEYSAKLLPNFLLKYENRKVSPVKQMESKATYTFSKTNPKSTKIFKEDALIDWSKNNLEIHNMVRAYNPWPVAWTFIKDMPYSFKDNVNKNLKVKIFKTKITEENNLEIETLQIEGKNIVNWKSFENGYLKK